MRRFWVGAGVASLLVTGLTAPPAAAVAPAEDAAVQPAPNPLISETCGIDASLILDASGSINTSGAVNTVRKAGQDLIAALKDTNSTLRVTQFGTFSGQLSSRVPVDATNTGSGGVLTKAMLNYYTPPPPRPAGVDIYRGNTRVNSELTWTNWEDGIKGIDRPQTELAIFVTDGDPTAYFANPARVQVGNDLIDGSALTNAITQANTLKAAGTRMLVVGVGKGLTSGSSQGRLKKISGPLLETNPAALAGKTINQVDAVAFPDFAKLGAFLRSVVTSLCGNSVTVQKLSQTSSGAEYVPATGWNITVQPTITGGFKWVDPVGPDDSAQTRATSGAQGTAAFQWKPKVASQKATVRVAESVNSGYTANRWTCDVKTTSGSTSTVSGTLSNATPSFQFDMNPSDVATCKLYNDFNYSPAITITKVPRDNPVRGNAAGWNEEYTFRVKNTGNSTLTVNQPVDPQCTSITGPTGPGAASGKLAPNDEWTYICAAKIGPVATVNTALKHTNNVSVTGVPPKGPAVAAQAQAKVDVKTPAIALAKTAKKTGGAAIADGGTVPAGTRVTYVYTVTNAGNDTLSLVRASAVTDDKCSPVTYKSGDLNNNQKLETNETWVYECDKVLNPPSSVTSVTNVASVTSNWSGWTAGGQNNTAVTDTARMTINIDRGANLRVVKVTNPGDENQDFRYSLSGQGVAPADTSFTLNTSSAPGTPPASRNIALDGPDGSGSVYTITETGVSGWNITDLDCSKAPESVNLATGEIKVKILPLEDVTCVFKNERKPTLTITKQTSPDGSTADFGFTATAPLAPSSFTLSDGESQKFSNITPGTATITESTVPAGWELDEVSCNVPFVQTGPTIVVTLEYGDDAECVYTNAELPPATVTIVKDGDQGTYDPLFDFTIEGVGLVTPGVPGTDSFELGLGDSKTYTVRPGTGGDDYKVTEGAPPVPPAGESRFVLADVLCVFNGDTQHPYVTNVYQGWVEMSVEPGDTVVCTFINRQKPRLTIVKNAVTPPDDPVDSTDFGFTANGLSPASFALSDQEKQVFTDVSPSAFDVTESPVPTHWTLTSLECTGQGSERVTTNTGQRRISSTGLQFGDDVVCTYVNTYTPPKAYLFVLKSTDPTGATADFKFTAKGENLNPPNLNASFTLTGDGDYTGFEIDPGNGGRTYTVTELPTAGWRLKELDCVLSTDPDTVIPPSQPGDSHVDVTVKAGEVAVCAFENQKLGTLSVDKVTSESSATLFDFTATNVTPGSFSLTGGGAPQLYTGITPGTQVVVTEDVPTAAPNRWKLSDLACDGATTYSTNISQATATVTVGAGEDVDCTYTDSRVPTATVQIVKVADPADGTSFDFRARGAQGGVSQLDRFFSLAPDGDIDVKTMTVHPADGGEVFTFTETPASIPVNWNLDEITCVNGGTSVGTADLPEGKIDVTINPGDTLTCTFSNREDATLTVVKEAADDPSQSFDFSWTAGTPTTFSLKDQESKPAAGLNPGKYTVQEIDLPTDWYLESSEGAHPVCVGGDNPVDYTPVLGAEVDLKAGEHVTCTFPNFFDYRPRMELVKTPDRTVVLEGKPVVYTYELKNTGNVDLTRIGALNDVVVDDQCSSVTYTGAGTPSTLAQGATWTFACTVSNVTPAKATNVAEATMQHGSETLKAKDTQTVEVRVPDLKVIKTVDKPIVYPATSVTYTYVARNLGETPFEGPVDRDAWIDDDTCSPVTFKGGDAGAASVLDIGEQWTYECTMPISVDTTNEVTFTATPFLPPTPESGGKQTGSPMEVKDTADVKVITRDITITKTPSAPGGVFQGGVLLVPVGSEVTYTYEVTSGTATTPMRVADITDDSCSPVVYQSGDDGDGLVEPGETWIYTCTSTFAGSTTVTNTAVVTAIEPILGGISTDSDQATVTSYQGSIAIKKSPSSELVPKGTPVTYTYTVLNNGPVDLTDIKVTDDKCSPVTYKSGDTGGGVMKPGDEWTYTCESALQADTTNVAEATGTTPSGGKVTDATSVTVLVVGGQLDPKIAVTKSPSANSVRRGDKVTYAYDVTNAGTMPLANIRVSDDKCAPVTYVKGDDNGDGLLTNAANGEGYPDETWVYTCTTPISKDTTNTVTAVGSPWWAGQVVGTDVTASAQANVKVSAKPPLPIDVDPVKKCKGNTCTVVKKSKTNKYGTLKYRTKCRPMGSSAAGEVRYCRTKVTKKGAVKVTIFGYKKVKVTVWITAKPKPKYKDQWKANTWKRSWIVRP